ncbi:uncharacterized protein C2845_PM07G38400 [Panicum miliaceum]|uniref:RRM domain-containing protein n=1 Tax=Panicum miliaceum TaxID=4540 RepID=A0A3L6SGL7_PANMI|nr:uncharacterized protein C2845_PM07G38400 [Panicum miliaceum]
MALWRAPYTVWLGTEGEEGGEGRHGRRRHAEERGRRRRPVCGRGRRRLLERSPGTGAAAPRRPLTPRASSPSPACSYSEPLAQVATPAAALPSPLRSYAAGGGAVVPSCVPPRSPQELEEEPSPPVADLAGEAEQGMLIYFVILCSHPFRYVTFAREDEAVRCIQAVNGYILDGKPLKATFGVTRYCHIWLSNRVCYKTNCSYVHYKASAEDTCTKDDVSVIRLQHLMGMDTKGPQHRSGRTLPPPGDCSSRTTTCGISKDVCINAEPNGANKNASLLPATTPRDSSLFSGSPSIANVVLHRRDDRESIHSNQQNLSDPKSQKYIPPGGRNRSSTTSVQHMQHSCRPIEGTSLESLSNMSLVPQGSKVHLNEQLDSNSDKSEASSQLGNDTLNSKQMTSAENGTSDTSQQKPQYSNVVSQGQVVSSRRFTILGRPKATGQIGNGISSSTKLAVVKDEHSDCITISRSHLVSQSRLELPSQQVSATVKSHDGAERKNGCPDIIEKLVPGNHKQLSESMASHRSTVVQSLSSSPVPSNLSTSDAKSQATAGPNDLSALKRKLASQNQLQLVSQQGAPVSNTVIARASLCHSTPNNQVNLTDGKRQDSAQGGHESFYNRKMVRSGAIVPSHCSDSTMLSRPTSAVSSTDVAAPDRKERKRLACPPGFEKPHHSSDSGKSVYVSSPACSGLCPASDALVKDSCGITDQQDLPSWATDCLKHDGDVTKNLNMSTSSRLGSTDTNQSDTNQRHGQFQGTFFSGWLNHPRLSPCPPHHKLEYWDGTTGSYMSTGGYDAFCQGTKSGMGGGMVGTLLQQPTMSSPCDRCTNRNTDSGMNGQKINISYPMYTLTTGISKFAEYPRHSAKVEIPSAKGLPSVTLGEPYSANFPSANSGFAECRSSDTRQPENTRQNITLGTKAITVCDGNGCFAECQTADTRQKENVCRVYSYTALGERTRFAECLPRGTRQRGQSRKNFMTPLPSVLAKHSAKTST